MYTKEQALKEWDKIKAYDILDTIEELEALFQEKPYGKCMRKYPAYAWCKENFFFGSPEELLEYYKNFTGIPFYMYYRIGQKFHSLTILDIYQDNENTIMAKCQCDCGEVVARKLDSILKGNARTCGCRKGKGKQAFCEVKRYITDINKDFIDKYWDYEKNNVAPATVEVGDSRNFWWKGYEGSYEMPASCLQAKRRGTSFPEQTILFFLKRNGVEVEHRKNFEVNTKKYEADIFLPKYDIAIEYDGVVWHTGKIDFEQEKNNALCSLGLYLIRIRETGLKPTAILKGREIERDLDEFEEISLSNVINELFDILNLLDENLHLIYITPEEVARNKPLIHSQYYYAATEDNIYTSWLIRLWSEENIVPPYMVSCKSNDQFIFNCRSAKIYASPSQMLWALRNIPKIKIKELSETLLLNERCPFTLQSGFLCPANCRYQLDNYVESCKYSPFNHPPFKQFMESYTKDLSKEVTLERYRKLIVDLMEYKRADWAVIILEGLEKNPMNNDKKNLLLYETLRYPYMNSAQLNKLFSNKKLCSVYLENYQYEKFDTEKIDLHLSHNENLYDIIAALIYEKNISVLDKVFSLIWQKAGQAIYDIFIYSAFLQFYANLSYDFTKFFDDKTSKEVFFGILKKNLSNQYKEKIENDLMTERDEFSEQLFSKYLSDANKLGEITKETIQSLSGRLAHSQEYYDMFVRIIENANIDICMFDEKENNVNQTDDVEDMGTLGEQLYNSQQRLIECYRHLICNSLKIGTIDYLESLVLDKIHNMPCIVKDFILVKLRDKQDPDIRKQEFNYFELLFNSAEKAVHEKYGKYVKGIIPDDKPKIQPKDESNQTKIYTPEQKPQKIEITVPVVDLDTKRKQQDQQRKEEARKRQERIEAQKRSYRNQGLCQHCGGAFKKKFIFFTSDICSRCGKKKDY